MFQMTLSVHHPHNKKFGTDQISFVWCVGRCLKRKRDALKRERPRSRHNMPTWISTAN